MKPSSGIGTRMEDAAAAYLQAAGLCLVARNYRSRHGEIDLIVKDGDTLVFVEVRYRRSNCFGSASASVDERKQRKLLTTAYTYLQQEKLDSPCRFDVIAIEGDPHRIQWIKDAFRA